MPQKTKKTQPVKVQDLQPKQQPKGGGKHLAGVKYEDVTVNCGTGTSKNTR